MGRDLGYSAQTLQSVISAYAIASSGFLLFGGRAADLRGEHTTSPGSSDLALQVSGDSTYTLKWGNRRPSTGTIADRGTRVILDDESGAQITSFTRATHSTEP